MARPKKTYKEWKEHFGPLAEVEEEKEKLESKPKKKRYKERKEHFGPLAEVEEEKEKLEREREKAAEAFQEESKEKIPSSEEIGQKLKEKEAELEKMLQGEKTSGGEKLSDGEVYNLTRNFYLGELNYSASYSSPHKGMKGFFERIKGFFRPKAWVLNEKKEYITDEKDRPIEFRTAWTPKGETSLLKFLKDKLRNKIEKDLEKRE